MSELIGALKDWGCSTSTALERFIDDEELYESCLRRFVGEEHFKLFSDAIESADYEQAFESAHALKGVSANLGLDPITRPASEATELLRAGNYDVHELERLRGEVMGGL